MNIRFLISIILLSSAVIAYQLNLMQILSIMQWYHFAYMIISIALMGFGTAGTFLAIFRKNLIGRFDYVLPWIMLLSGISMTSVIPLAQLSIFRFDSYLLFSDYSHIFRLAAAYILFIIPFFFAALAIGLIFVKYVEAIGKLYFANLFGSGLGGLAAVVLILIFLPTEIPGFIGILPALASAFVFKKGIRFLFYIVLIIAFGFSTYYIVSPPEIILSQYKSLSRTKNLPDAEIILKEKSPYGLIEAVVSSALRYAPGLSLKYRGELKTGGGVFINGDWAGPLTGMNENFILDYTPAALPFVIAEREEVLVLNSGTGKYLQHSLVNKAETITAVEPNGNLVSLLKNELAGYTDSVYNNASVSVQVMDPRTYLFIDKNKYDLIVLPDIGAFGGTSGLYAIQENYLLTTESFSQMWERLKDNGVISITSWLDYPYRNPLKVLSVISEVLYSKGIRNIEDYTASVRGWATITFVVRKTPLVYDEIRSVKNFCDDLLFDPVILAGLKKDERTMYNTLQDERFFDYVDEILSERRRNFIEQYDFNIAPPTDNQPYFSQFIKWGSVTHIAELFGSQAVPFFEIGYIIVVITFIQILIFASLLIILPLFKIGFKGKYRFWTILYFSGIGIGYMFVEIVLIQRFILYFGNPVYSVAAVIAFMLICSGAGSYFSSKLNLSGRIPLKVFGVIILMLLLYSFLLIPVLQNTIAASLPVKIIILLLTVGFPALAMGIPFPLGLRFVNQKNTLLTPWAWGINGVTSVLSTVLATILAVELGFSWVIIIAAGAYMISLFLSVRN
jgi:hypothetical protein